MFLTKLSPIFVLCSFTLLITSKSSALGQSEPAKVNDAASRAGCELHIWPTDKFAVTEGVDGGELGIVGALLDSAMRMKSPEGIAEQFKQQLDPVEQARILGEMSLPTLFRLSGYRAVIEPATSQPIWTLDRMKSDEPISKAHSGCHAEMAIISQQYLHQPIGTRLRTFIWYREYNGPKTIRRVLGTTAAKARDFPAQQADGITASTASLQAAFRENILKFAKDKLKP